MLEEARVGLRRGEALGTRREPRVHGRCVEGGRLDHEGRYADLALLVLAGSEELLREMR